jgi:amidohydrolase
MGATFLLRRRTLDKAHTRSPDLACSATSVQCSVFATCLTGRRSGADVVGMYDDLWAALEAELPDAVEFRRRLHQVPDRSGEEAPTRELEVSALPDGVGTTTCAGTGGVVRVGGDGAAVGVRGEMDALAVAESTGVEWASRRFGLMHACGHDVHLAAVVAVARAVHRVGAPRALLVVLQPREETHPSGARDMVEAGLLDAEQCVAMVGAHVHPGLPGGTVACAPGGVNASSEEFEITVRGETGHAAYPHLTHDPVLALSHVVIALQSVVSRSVDPMEPAVVGVSALMAGRAANVVPGEARARGTVRALSAETRAVVHRRIAEIASAVARAERCTAEVEFMPGLPVLCNHPGLAGEISTVLGSRGVPVSDTLRSLGADDFSFFAARVPSVMTFVGTETDVPLHSGGFLPSDTDVRRVAHTMLAGFLGACAFTAAEAVAPTPTVPASSARHSLTQHR